MLVLWAFANGYVPWLSFAEHPYYLVALALAVPVIHEFHFYCIHRLIHMPVLYQVGPFGASSLGERFALVVAVDASGGAPALFQHRLLALIIPSNPIIALYQLHFAGFGAIPGHVGFHQIEVGKNGLVDSHAYEHHLHHKYFEVNYGSALIPLDHGSGPGTTARPRARRRCGNASGAG